MNDTLGYMRHEPDPPQVPPRRADLQPDLRLPRELRPAAVARRGGPRQGLAAGPDARRPLAEVRQPAAAVQLHVDASRARSCCSWAATSASGTSGTSTPACNGTCCSGTSHQGLQKCVADLNRLLPPREGPARGRLRLPRLRVDRLPQLRGQHAELHPPGQGPRRLPGGLLQLHAGAAAAAPPGRARGLLVRGDLQQRLDLLRRQQHGQRPGRAGRADRRATAGRPRSCSRCRRWPPWCSSRGGDNSLPSPDRPSVGARRGAGGEGQSLRHFQPHARGLRSAGNAPDDPFAADASHARFTGISPAGRLGPAFDAAPAQC